MARVALKVAICQHTAMVSTAPSHALYVRCTYKSVHLKDTQSPRVFLTLTPPQHPCYRLPKRSSRSCKMGQVDAETATIAYAVRDSFASPHRRYNHYFQRYGCHWRWKDDCRSLPLIGQIKFATPSFRIC